MAVTKSRIERHSNITYPSQEGLWAGFSWTNVYLKIKMFNKFIKKEEKKIITRLKTRSLSLIGWVQKRKRKSE
jgi:hypothetical protein